MGYDRSQIGVEKDCGSMVIEQGKIHEFAKAVGIRDTLCHDSAAAEDAGYDGTVAPPTYMAASAFWATGMAAPGVLGMDLKRLLHGEQSYEQHRPVVAGDRLHGTRVITDLVEKEGKRGGTMTLVTEEVRWRDDHGEPVVTSRAVYVETAGKVEKESA